ncbi:MAG: type IX secretion system membrane protein PorP/SprF [Pedobacter sp.]|uniref:PorP/SprF family type IX secretion system membrane protein n=1 Tax=Pedobacter sp. TaxID=1411316 RepID=UPI0028072BB4|nr:type IX secretion system membrane protein PorP/SprF [Pedobacter sp.]MDQ8004139.1 type IX secretion system membrane protein PorP/SprF [Pedobacter sp.]
MQFKTYFYLLFFTILAATPLFAQQRPQYTQYIFNNYLLNPALSGIENYMDVKVGHRAQWAGIENAPKTSFLSAHWNLGADYLWKNPLSLPEKGDDPMSRSYTQNYTSSPAHHGMGIMAVSDKAGPISRFDAGLTYAYHLQTGGASNLAVGVYAGLSRIALDVNAIKLENDGDPALANVLASQFKPDVGIGIWYYGARFFAGASAQQILPMRLAFTKDANYDDGKTVPHFFLTSGYRLSVDEEISAIPSVMLKRVEGLPISFDANIKFDYKDKIWIGGSYRKSDSFSAMLGFNFKNLVNFTYAYDLTTSGLRTISSGSHEIVLGFQLANAYEVFSGGRYWR